MDSKRALIVDDEADIRSLLEITLSRMGLDTIAAADLSSARRALADGDFDLCLTDMRLPDGLGIELVREIHAADTPIPVAVITAYGNTEDAVDSLKAGAFDFVTKPVNIEVLRRLVDTALRIPRSGTPPGAEAPTRLIGDTPEIQALRKVIGKLARNQAPVHICGESGTGKELAARMIHDQGARGSHGFVPVNCGAVPAELMESEFFGHIKGSFTGATADRQGLFQAAEGGTLFLDEVADLPLNMQVKLLRAIQERKIRPVGGDQEIAVDVRIISATHRNLREEVAEGRFREDLFYRLNVIEIRVPPLRERRADIPALARELLSSIAERHGTQSPTLSRTAEEALYAYDFPGNVRELENVLERAAALSDGTKIQREDLALQSITPAAAEQDSPVAADSIDERLERTEREKILEALQKTRYNKTRAAELLGISFRSLRYRLKKLGID